MTVVQYLRHKNIRTILLSGDRYDKCRQLADFLGIDEVIAEQTPQEKLGVVEDLTLKGPTAMVGDGINDAPALAKATVGISLSAASQIAVQTADVVLMNHGIRNLPLSARTGPSYVYDYPPEPVLGLRLQYCCDPGGCIWPAHPYLWCIGDGIERCSACHQFCSPLCKEGECNHIMSYIRSLLKEYWKYDAFRLMQEDIINAVLEREDTLAILPTGGGKSLCFQLPALAQDGLLPRDQPAHRC